MLFKYLPSDSVLRRHYLSEIKRTQTENFAAFIQETKRPVVTPQVIAPATPSPMCVTNAIIGILLILSVVLFVL